MHLATIRTGTTTRAVKRVDSGTSPVLVDLGYVDLGALLADPDGLTKAAATDSGTTYDAADVAWGHRMCDVLEVRADGGLTIDLRRFDAIEPASPTETFPYPAPAATAVETVSPEGTA